MYSLDMKVFFSNTKCDNNFLSTVCMYMSGGYSDTAGLVMYFAFNTCYLLLFIYYFSLCVCTPD